MSGLIQVLMFVAFAASALAEPAPTKPLPEPESVPLLQSRIKQVDDLHDLDDATKAKIKELYQQAIGETEAGKHWAETADQYEKAVANAPDELNATKAALAAPSAREPAPLPANATLPRIEKMISERQAKLEQSRADLTKIEADLKNRVARRVELPKLLSAAHKRLADINLEIQAATANADDNSPLQDARRLLLVARRRAAEKEAPAYEKELAAYDALTELLPLRRDQCDRDVASAEQDVKSWQDVVNQRRRLEAERQARQAASQAAQALPAVRAVLDYNAKLAEMRKDLVDRNAQATTELGRVNQQLANLRQEFTRVQERVKASGKTRAANAVGQQLRGLRERLPNVGDYRRKIAIQEQAVSDGQLAMVDLNEQRRLLADPRKAADQMLLELDDGRQVGNRTELEIAIRNAIQTEKDYLDALIGVHDVAFKNLLELQTAEGKLIEETEECARFIDERVLWIASTGAVAIADVRHAADAFGWLAGPNAWIELGRTLWRDAANNLSLTSLAIGAFVLLVYLRLRFRARIREIGEKAARGNCYRFVPTLETSLLTVLIAAAWPGLMWYVGWRLVSAAELSELSRAWGEGLLATARVFFALELLRHTCGLRGLGESHFAWSNAALRLVRQNIRWFTLPALALMCVAVAMAWQRNEWDSSLGRFCFIAAIVCFAFMLHRLFRPRGVVVHAMIAARHGGWLERLRYVWYPLCVLTPVALAVLAMVGYHYTARQLVLRLILTSYVLVGGIVFRSLLLRWTLVNQRKLAIEGARQRRAAAQSDSASTDDGSAELPTTTTPERDLATINTQTRRLIEYAVGTASALAVWYAWLDVLPALGSLNVKLGATADGVSITLGSLFLAGIVLATTVIAAKNIPGLLEMAVLQHLPLDAGARYAAATVCRYLITVVGVVLCCGTLGVGWSKVQWLVAAMSLGLGFGLQEIFANFISGLIILIERPIRVGDIVTLDGTTGVVARIRMRATTVTDPDRRELIIPNKEFITGRVLNWTLTDPVNRVVVKVGVAYGSDTQQAAEILLGIARSHQHVLADPPPSVALESFGDSSLNFVLRCFLPSLENRGAVIHELHMAVDREFRAAGVEIAFPQQDVHVRSIDVQWPLSQATASGDQAFPPSQRAA